MKKSLFFILFFVSVMVAFAQQSLPSNHSSTSFEQKKLKTKKYTYKIISSQHNTFGYEIYADNKLMIKQNTIPSRQGNEGFVSKKQAKMVAKIVLHKLNKGMMPPTITADELLKAGV